MGGQAPPMPAAVQDIRSIMEKWKVAAIIGLLVALAGFGLVQSKQDQSNSSTNNPNTTLPPEDTKPPRITQWEGKHLPPFSIPKKFWTNTDKPLTVDDYKGKVLLLEIWRAECPHCKEAIPFMESLDTSYGPRGLHILSLHSPAAKGTVEYNWPELIQRIKEWGIKYPVGYDQNRKIFDMLKAERFPTTIVIGRDGVVTYSNQGFTEPLRDKLLKAIEKTLASD
jgi:thiol-disulfide isomerase/thioredoxin